MFNVQRSSHLSPRASRLSPLAMAPAAGPGAAPLRPDPRCRPTCNVQRSTFNPSRPSPHPLAPRASRLAPRAPAPAIAGPGAAPLRPSTLSSHVQRATFNLQPLAPLAPHPLAPRASRLTPLAMAPAAGPGAAPLRPSTLSSHVQRATFNLQPLAPLASSPHASRLSPLTTHAPDRYRRSIPAGCAVPGSTASGRGRAG